MSVTLEVLHVPACPNLSPLVEHLREVTDRPVTTREISDAAEASVAGMAGSPTLLINGRDPFPAPTPQGGGSGVSCRIYRDEHGHVVAAPSVEQLRAAIAGAVAAAGVSAGVASVDEPHAISDGSCCDPVRPGEVLSARRTRALPLDPVENAVHRAILRAFATTGHPPTATDLEPATAGSGRAAADVLAALHELDAIRLSTDGRIAVAYPFSATPTRHRVRIGERLEVHAMCAIDALGISAMLGEDTWIDSVDVNTGYPVTVATTEGVTRWEPAGAVVFLGADAAGGPSADCCCDHLNFFVDTAGAQAWTAAHPHVPGQILTQAEAEYLGTRLFGHLLAT